MIYLELRKSNAIEKLKEQENTERALKHALIHTELNFLNIYFKLKEEYLVS